MDIKKVVCIVCPIGCSMLIMATDGSYQEAEVKGNRCPKGKEYGIRELLNPTRVLTSTVKIKNAHLRRLPVKSNKAIDKDLILKCIDELNYVHVEGPLKLGDIAIENVLKTGADIVASRSMQ